MVVVFTRKNFRAANFWNVFILSSVTPNPLFISGQLQTAVAVADSALSGG